MDRFDCMKLCLPSSCPFPPLSSSPHHPHSATPTTLPHPHHPATPTTTLPHPLSHHAPLPQTWNLDNQLPILALQRHEKPVHSMAVWQDSVFTGSEDMEIKV